MKSEKRAGPTMDPNVRAALMFAAAAIGATLAILAGVGFWPALGPAGSTAMTTIGAILSATMAAVGLALSRRGS